MWAQDMFKNRLHYDRIEQTIPKRNTMSVRNELHVRASVYVKSNDIDVMRRIVRRLHAFPDCPSADN